MGRLSPATPATLLSAALLLLFGFVASANALPTSCVPLSGTPSTTCTSTSIPYTNGGSAYPGQSVSVDLGTVQAITNPPATPPASGFGWQVAACPGGLGAVQIAWGDGSVSAPSSQSPLANGAIPVGGAHTYGRLGTYAATATSSDPSCSVVSLDETISAITVGGFLIATNKNLNSTALTVSTNVVSCGSLAISPNPQNAEIGASFSGVVASFSEQQTHAAPCPASGGPFTALIDWGDGQSTPGTISPDGDGYSVGGSHTYASTGNRVVTITASGADGTTGSTASMMNVGCINNVFALGKPAYKPNGAATVTATVPCAGEIVVTAIDGKSKSSSKKRRRAKPLIKGSAQSAAGGAIALSIRPTAIATKLLKRTGKLSATVKIAYTPTHGSARTANLKLTLKRKLGKKR